MLNHSPPKGGDTVTHGPSTLQGKCHLAILYVLECLECGVEGTQNKGPISSNSISLRRLPSMKKTSFLLPMITGLVHPYQTL